MADVQPGPEPGSNDEVVEGELLDDPDAPLAEVTVETLVTDLERVTTARDEFRDAYQRAAADFDNFRKQSQRRLDDEVARTSGALVERLLPVLDACDGALAHGAAEVEPIAVALLAALEKEGLVRVDPIGEVFDPTVADAVVHEPGGGGDHIVSEVMRPGYTWQGRVLRPAMVKVTDSMAPQREWFEKDYYRVLGVSESASAKDIKSAYRKLSREYHPDTNPGDAAAEERFKEVSAAYDVVGNAERRKEYDEVRRMGPAAAGFPGGGGGAGGFQFQDAGDLGDLLGGLFGRGGGSGRGRRGPHRGQDLETELHLTFDDAVAGVTTAVHLTSDAPCRTCNGSGATPGTVPHRCANCGGQGVVSDNQGLFSLSSPCPVCSGRGVTIDDPCPTCRGTGVERRPREVKVRVPAGVDDGQRIRLKGRGGPGQSGGPAGDLYVVVRVSPHPLFRRHGRDLTIAVPITFPEAAFGADVAVPTLDGGPVRLRIPPGTRSGRTFRVKGKGVATAKGTGDLLATVEVAVPSTLSSAERKALEAFQAASDGASPREHLGV